jgi:ribosomal protein L7Ae-like RNA K-turn-binding protein
MNARQTPLTHALGLCARARGLITGVPMICQAMQTPKSRPQLVLVASDVSDNTKKRLADKCAYYGVPSLTLPMTTEALAHAVGKSASLGAVGLTDENFCRLIRSAVEKTSNETASAQ